MGDIVSLSSKVEVVIAKSVSIPIVPTVVLSAPLSVSPSSALIGATIVEEEGEEEEDEEEQEKEDEEEEEEEEEVLIGFTFAACLFVIKLNAESILTRPPRIHSNDFTAHI